MNVSDAKKRIEKLKKSINRHRYLYHVLDKQEISDEAHDSLKHELAELEKKFPELVTKDSPTQRVGGEPLEKFEKAEHARPMLSMDDIFTKEELEDWEKYLKRLLPDQEIEYFCETKIDGFAISLLYKDGFLTRAATRGNGRVGENVTGNIKTVESIPLNLKLESGFKGGQTPLEIEVRGEVYMDKKTFIEVNREQKKKGEKEYANPRNLAAGSVRQLDPRLTASRKLKFIAYDIADSNICKKHSEKHNILHELGFRTDKHIKICKSIKDIYEFWQEISKDRENLYHQIDGVVVTVNDNYLFDKLGVSGKSPRGVRAFKFSPKQATTILEDVQFHVGRTGAVTPIAHLKPVKIGGVTVSRATLHNQDEIKRLDARIGDTVVVGRAGDVIPDITSVIKELRGEKEKIVLMPEKCPVCKGVLKRTEEVILRCINKKCPARSLEYLHFFISKKAFDIDGLGPKIVDQLVKEGLVSSPADLFDLREGDLIPLERFQEKSAKNIVSSIAQSRDIPLARFIHALGIRHVGEETSIDLAQYFGSIDAIKKASMEEIQNIPDIGEVVARGISDWFADRDNVLFVNTLFKKGVKIQKSQKTGTRFKGKTFVFTGTLESTTRQEAERQVRMLGGDPSGSVSSATDYVVAGESPGSKYNKAQELGVKIISEKEFLEMIKEK